jgi:putative hydrolase of the HAD superfamily
LFFRVEAYHDFMIQAIVYDAVGTLIHVQPSVATIYATVGRRFGSQLEPDEIRQRFHAAFSRQDRLDEQAGWRTSETRELDRWRAIVAEVLEDVADSDACFAVLFETFGQTRSWSCDPEAGELLADLHQRGWRQALASNFDRRLRGVIEPMPIARNLETLVLSSEIGWRKPALEFFAHIAASLQLPPETILFVGDDRDNDYSAARRAGMRAVLLDPHKKYLDVQSDRIERLRDVFMVM